MKVTLENCMRYHSDGTPIQPVVQVVTDNLSFLLCSLAVPKCSS